MKFGHQMTPLALFAKFATRLHNLHWIALLALLVSIKLVSSSARVTSVKSQGLWRTDGHPDPKIGSQVYLGSIKIGYGYGLVVCLSVCGVVVWSGQCVATIVGYKCCWLLVTMVGYKWWWLASQREKRDKWRQEIWRWQPAADLPQHMIGQVTFTTNLWSDKSSHLHQKLIPDICYFSYTGKIC